MSPLCHTPVPFGYPKFEEWDATRRDQVRPGLCWPRGPIRKMGVIVFRRIALASALAVGAGLVVIPAANAEVGHNLEENLYPGRSVAIVDGGWRVGTNQDFFFQVTVKNTAGQSDTDLSVLVSVPFEVTGYSGAGWTCVDVDGGVDCSVPDSVRAGGTWPSLYVDAVSGPDEIEDSVDVYADSRHGDVHAGVPFGVDSF